MAALVVLKSGTGFVVRLRAFDALNSGDKMGILSIVADPALIACAQTRSRWRSSLKCRLDAR